MKIRLLPFIFLCSLAFADERTNDVYLYFHPLTLPINPFVLGSMWYDDRPLTVYLTLEYSINRYFSIPVNPSLWFKYDDYYKIGSGIGIRYYFGGSDNYDYTDVIYLQVMPAHHLKHSLSSEKVSERNTDIKGYIGFAREGVFFDIGIGGSPGHKGVSVDINFALGFEIL